MNKIESRHQLIRSLVMENKIHTQQELQELLELNGVEVTQSTLSRDIKLLNLVKITESGSSYYVINSIAPSRWESKLISWTLTSSRVARKIVISSFKSRLSLKILPNFKRLTC